MRGDVREVPAIDRDVGQREAAELGAAEVGVLEAHVAQGDAARADTRELGAGDAGVLEERAALQPARREREVLRSSSKRGASGPRGARVGRATRRSEARPAVGLRPDTDSFRS